MIEQSSSKPSALLIYLDVFRRYTYSKVFLVFAFVTLASIAEAFGLVLFIPLIESFDISNPAGSGTGDIGLFKSLGISFADTSFNKSLLFIVLLFLLKGILLLTAEYLKTSFKVELQRLLRSEVASLHSTLAYSYYATKDSGQLIALLTGHVTKLAGASHIAISLVNSILQAIVYVCIALALTWEFAIWAICSGLLLVSLLNLLTIRARRHSHRLATETNAFTNAVIQSLSGFKYLLSTNQTYKFEKKIISSSERLASIDLKIGILQAITAKVKEPLAVIFILCLVWFQVQIEGQPITPILASILLLYRCFSALLSVQSNYQSLASRAGSVEIVMNEIDGLMRHQEVNLGRVRITSAPEIILRDVHFKYDGRSNSVLRGVNLVVPARSTIALIGRSGSGKSTIVDMISGVLKPSSGEILINSVSIDDLDLGNWRRHIGFVGQEPTIFDDTLANNILLKYVAPSDHENRNKLLLSLAQRAYIDRLVDELPSGFETKLGEKGILLSGGQKQRICIARELATNPSLLVLDEATSALDSASESEINRTIEHLKGEISVIVIAHRLSTVKNVDLVYVIDNGHIVESGSYSELRKKDGSMLNDFIRHQIL